MSATVHVPSKTPAVSAKLILPFIDSVRAVFSTMINIEATIGRPELKHEPAVSYDASSIIGFSGDVVGNMVVSFPMPAAEKVVSAFAGAPMNADDPDFADALGEIANMIAGGAKKHLALDASITCPSVIIGTGHHVARLRDVPCIVIPCQTPVGGFAVEMSIRQVQPGTAPEGGLS